MGWQIPKFSFFACLHPVLALSNYTSVITLHAALTVLTWNFDVKYSHVILGHNVEFRGPMSRWPILVPFGGRFKIGLFEMMKWAEVLAGESYPSGFPTPGGCTTRVRVERLQGPVSLQKESDSVTLGQKQTSADMTTDIFTLMSNSKVERGH